MRRTKPPVGWEHVKNCFPVPNELLDFDLSAGAVAVYIYLLRHANRKTNQCHPSEATIAKRLHLSRNTVAKHVRLLEERGLIVTDRAPASPHGEVSRKTAICSTRLSQCTRSWSVSMNDSSQRWTAQRSGIVCRQYCPRSRVRENGR